MFPPVAEILILPIDDAHWSLVIDTKLTVVPLVIFSIVSVIFIIQPELSVISQVYVPASIFVKSSDVAPLLHKKE